MNGVQPGRSGWVALTVTFTAVGAMCPACGFSTIFPVCCRLTVSILRRFVTVTRGLGKRGRRGGVFAEFETNLRKERQLEGIAKAKTAGVYKGRPATIEAAQLRELKARGVGASAIAKRLKIGRASVYRILGT